MVKFVVYFFLVYVCVCVGVVAACRWRTCHRHCVRLRRRRFGRSLDVTFAGETLICCRHCAVYKYVCRIVHMQYARTAFGELISHHHHHHTYRRAISVEVARTAMSVISGWAAAAAALRLVSVLSAKQCTGRVIRRIYDLIVSAEGCCFTFVLPKCARM